MQPAIYRDDSQVRPARTPAAVCALLCAFVCLLPGCSTGRANSRVEYWVEQTRDYPPGGNSIGRCGAVLRLPRPRAQVLHVRTGYRQRLLRDGAKCRPFCIYGNTQCSSWSTARRRACEACPGSANRSRVMTRFSIHSFVLRNLRGLGMASDFRRMKSLLLPFLALLFIAAPSGPAEAGAHSLDSRELLNTVYPEARVDAPTVGTNSAPLRIASIILPNVKWPWFPKPGHDTTSDTDSTTVEIVPLNVTQFDEQHAVMITPSPYHWMTRANGSAARTAACSQSARISLLTPHQDGI